MTTEERPEIAFVLSLAGGALMLLGGVISFTCFMAGGFGWGGMMGGFGGMMGGYQSMMGDFGVPFGSMSGLSIIGLVSGILVTIGAVMLNAHPAEHVTWGAIILAFSVISLIGMGGFFIGAMLGIAGGAIAVSWRTTTGTKK